MLKNLLLQTMITFIASIPVVTAHPGHSVAVNQVHGMLHSEHIFVLLLLTLLAVGAHYLMKSRQ